MKHVSLFMLLSFCGLALNARTTYCIKPKGYTASAVASAPQTNQMSSLNKVGGHFRLIEFVAAQQKTIETDLVTYFIAKNQESTVTFQVNCARQILLHYIISDHKGKHAITVSEPMPYYRFSKELDLSRLRDGLCTLSVYNEKDELIHTIEFEKTTL